MIEEGEVSLIGGKFISFRAVGKSIEQIRNGRPIDDCVEMKVMHSLSLVSLQGIEEFRQLSMLNLASNGLTSIKELSALTRLHQLDVKCNRLVSLKGIENCANLVKLDASHNLIQSLEAIGAMEGHSIEWLCLSGNRVNKLEELEHLTDLSRLRQVYFEKGKASNPFCKDKDKYLTAIAKYLFPLKKSLLKIDEREDLSNIWDRMQERKEKLKENERQNEGYRDRERSDEKQWSRRDKLTQQLMFASTQNRSLGDMLGMKEQMIEQLKAKVQQLDISNSNYYRECLKRESEHERLIGQNVELMKSMEQRERKISQLHVRIEDLLKTNTTNAQMIEAKMNELEKARQTIADLKVEVGEYRMVSKTQQKRLEDLQMKTLSNIEQKAIKAEEMRRRGEQAMRQNYELGREKEELKDRVAELTRLLHEWQYKYENRIKELEGFHNAEKMQIIKEYQADLESTERQKQTKIRQIYEQVETKLTLMESQYKRQIDSLKGQCNQLRKSLQEARQAEIDLKNLLRGALEKNSEQEGLIQEFQKLIVASRTKIEQLSANYDQASREAGELRQKYEITYRQLNDISSRQTLEKVRLEKQVRQLRESNEYLRKAFDDLDRRQKEWENTEQKLEELEAALQAKNIMLDDKNETIENLKASLQAMSNWVDPKEFEKVNSKYRKLKDRMKEVEQSVATLGEENKQMQEKLDSYANTEQEFKQLAEVLGKQEAELSDKNKNIVELIGVLQKVKNNNQLLKSQLEQSQRETKRFESALEENEAKNKRQIRAKQAQFKNRYEKLEEEMNKYKDIAIKVKTLQSLTDRLNI